MLQKRHYQTLAESIGRAYGPTERDARERTINALYPTLRSNPRFCGATFTNAVLEAQARAFAAPGAPDGVRVVPVAPHGGARSPVVTASHLRTLGACSEHRRIFEAVCRRLRVDGLDLSDPHHRHEAAFWMDVGWYARRAGRPSYAVARYAPEWGTMRNADAARGALDRLRDLCDARRWQTFGKRLPKAGRTVYVVGDPDFRADTAYTFDPSDGVPGLRILRRADGSHVSDDGRMVPGDGSPYPVDPWSFWTYAD